MITRIKTGISGLDELIDGGIPEGFKVLLSGGPGAGKSILGLQYLWAGAHLGERGVYVSLEEDVNKLFAQAEEFGWGFPSVQDKVKFLTYSLDSQYQREDIIPKIVQEVKNFKATRLVFDSLNAYLDFTLPKIMGDNIGEGVATRYATHLMMDELAKIDKLTSLLINEEIEARSVAEFMADGVIALKTYSLSSKTARQVSIPKMRLTKLDLTNHTFEFTNKGISLSSRLR